MHLQTLKSMYCKSKDTIDLSCEPLLSEEKLNRQNTLFIVTIKTQCSNEKGLRGTNSVTSLWKRLSQNHQLCKNVSKYVTIINISLVLIIGSVDDDVTLVG